jgi:AcrR family transcriptional regulator
VRITEEKKEETKRRMLEAARELFQRKGFDQATTRDIAQAAGVAAGTLFNYFPTKEAVAMALVAEGLRQAREEQSARRRMEETPEEALFALVAAQLRRLKPYRRLLPALLETLWSPWVPGAPDSEAELLRVEHLESVRRIVAAGEEVDPPFLHLYWSLYTGVLAFWSKDSSRHQEETLAVLDQATRMFVRAFPAVRPKKEEDPQ